VSTCSGAKHERFGPGGVGDDPNLRKEADSKPMASNAVTTGQGGGEPPRAVPVRREGGGFFSVYKKGQGKWTRLGTAGGALLLIFFCGTFLYSQIPAQFFPTKPDTGRQVAVSVAGVVVLVLAFIGWRLMNKPTQAQFLIDTDGEMKKVNWTTRKELIGSTRVVIIFMFSIAAFLFVFDIAFGYFFYFIRILYTPPF